MNKNYHKFLIFIAAIIALGGVYVYFSNNLDVLAATTDSSLSSSQGTSSPLGDANNDAVSDKISEDTAFLSTLTSLNKLKINTSIFSSKSFNSLKDNTVVLEQSVLGRPNPFAPIDNIALTNTTVSPVITNQPTQVTDKSVVLAGGVSSTVGVTTTYFEYGLTENLSDKKATAPSKQSLIGTFVTSVTGLKSATPYFFRAVAKINGTFFYGDIVPFITN